MEKLQQQAMKNPTQAELITDTQAANPTPTPRFTEPSSENSGGGTHDPIDA